MVKRRTYKKQRKSSTKRRKANTKNIKRISFKKLHKGHRKNMRKMRGGMVSSPASGLVGHPWSTEDVNSQYSANYFAPSKYGIAVGGINPAQSTSNNKLLIGGKSGTNCRQNGGFFQEIANLGRGVATELNSGYFNLMGKTQPISQNPYPQDQPIDTNYKYIGKYGQPTNISKIFNQANNKVVKL